MCGGLTKIISSIDWTETSTDMEHALTEIIKQNCVYYNNYPTTTSCVYFAVGTLQTAAEFSLWCAG